ncbi:DUF423 domain-containing protein [Thalassotalea sp. M1531]|uniref:DUF423 domain-containing protein n=1 Tax=Thalassotalea algicola TaxID=2716224 RepID=A0A7Y0LF59_9GAMM|nr:DUF423 domain-containing protein [Thalassotalea algicola]NMP33296.1 DUF423 domain-containing protein [Thalassotalea algicola]
MTGNWQVKVLTLFVGISGCFCVLFGAWLAHAGSHLASEVTNRLSTAHIYQFIHTLALFATVVWIQVKPDKWKLVTAWLFLIGIVGFSVSLYLKTLFAVPFIGKVTPLGGVTLSLAWLSLFFYAMLTRTPTGKNE